MEEKAQQSVPKVWVGANGLADNLLAALKGFPQADLAVSLCTELTSLSGIAPEIKIAPMSDIALMRTAWLAKGYFKMGLYVGSHDFCSKFPSIPVCLGRIPHPPHSRRSV